MSVLIAVAVGLAAVFALAVLFAVLAAAGRALHEGRQWARVTHDIIRTDSRMLGDAFRLSLSHFQAVNELRKLGGRR